MTRAPVVITDLTRMRPPRVCLAGYRLDGDEPVCVRPLFPDGDVTERWLFANGRAVVRPFTVLELDLKRHRAEPPHTEDWHIAWGRRLLGRFSSEQRRALLAEILDPDIAAIFAGAVQHDNGWFVPAGTGLRSLGTVHAATIDAVVYRPVPERGRWDYRIGFTDAAGIAYRLPVTDLTVRAYLDNLRIRGGLDPNAAATTLAAALTTATEVILRIGLTRGWERFPERCFLQITGLYTTPDYLGGRCFADFPDAVSPDARDDVPVDVPF